MFGLNFFGELIFGKFHLQKVFVHKEVRRRLHQLTIHLLLKRFLNGSQWRFQVVSTNRFQLLEKSNPSDFTLLTSICTSQNLRFSQSHYEIWYWKVWDHNELLSFPKKKDNLVLKKFDRWFVLHLFLLCIYSFLDKLITQALCSTQEQIQFSSCLIQVIP